MFVKDYELIQNIDVLFEKKIIIYGAGKLGKITAELLGDIAVDFDCFCDRDKNKKQEWNHPVITVEELKLKTDREECIVIVGSQDFCQEMVGELQNRKINAYICTWYGVKTGIELNINDRRIPEEFSGNFIRRSEIWMRSIGGRIPADEVKCLGAYPAPVFVYQPGKVGSVTIYRTLLNEKIAVFQTHFFFHCMEFPKNGGVEYGKMPNEDIAFLVSMHRKRKNPLKIIVSVREPIARAVANFMQTFSLEFVLGYPVGQGIEASAQNWIKKELTEDFEFTWWFEEELKALTGIDIYRHPFDRERGYSWIKEDGIEILLLKMERMNDNVGIIGEFVGKPDIKLVNDNVGAAKQYQYIYEELKKRIKIPVELIKQQYQGNSRVDHFYTEEEKKAYMQKWMRGSL